jgi:hypothetical protein
MEVTHDSHTHHHPRISHANVLQLQTGIRRMVKYLHAAAFSPIKSTWMAAIVKGYYASWPGLTPSAVQNTIPRRWLQQKATWIKLDKTFDPPKIKLLKYQSPST